MKARNLELSIVIPVLNEEDNIYIVWDNLYDVLKRFNYAYEVIFIDDGSVDASPKILKDIQKNNLSVKIISFKRCFGQTAALSAGFNYAKGDFVVSMDCDLQNDPEDIPKLLEKNKKGCDLVCGWRKKRKDPFFTKLLPSLIANKIIRCVFNIKLHDIGCTLKAYKRKVVKNIDLYRGMHRFIPLLAKQAGFTYIEVEVNHYPRLKGKSKYGISRIKQVVPDLINLKFPSIASKTYEHFFGKITIIFFIFSLFFIFLLIFVNKFLYPSCFFAILSAASLFVKLFIGFNIKRFRGLNSGPKYVINWISA